MTTLKIVKLRKSKFTEELDYHCMDCVDYSDMPTKLIKRLENLYLIHETPEDEKDAMLWDSFCNPDHLSDYYSNLSKEVAELIDKKCDENRKKGWYSHLQEDDSYDDWKQLNSEGTN